MARDPAKEPRGPASDIAAMLARGRAAYREGRLDDAEAMFRAVLSRAPAQADARHALGAVLARKGAPDDGIREIERTLKAKPDFPEALSSLGNILREHGRREDALASYDRALAIRPRYAGALLNRGNVLVELNRPEEALASYDAAIAVRPDYVEAHANRANALRELRRPDDAFAAYARALALRPDDPEALFGEAVLRLVTGDYAVGFRGFEARWHKPGLAQDRRAFDRPLWLGDSDIAGKTVLLHAEQGIGDTIQFCRYATLVAALGARIVLEVHPPLATLMAGLEGVEKVVARGDPLPDFDAHCPLLSTPLALRTTLETIPASGRYLEAPAGRITAWGEALGPARGPRVGLAWAGNPAHANDHNRSIPARALAPLMGRGAELIALQHDMGEADRAWLDSHPEIRPVGPGLGDMGDAAGLIHHLDLVISVDTAAAHLAGALGKPVWILLPHLGVDWRWMWERGDSPWYPTARLFRQSADAAWPPVIATVAEELAALTRSGGRLG